MTGNRNNTDYLKKIEELIREQFTKPRVTEITLATRMSEDLGFDSLDMVEFVTNLEMEFGIEISDEEMGEFHTVADILSFTEKACSEESQVSSEGAVPEGAIFIKAPTEELDGWISADQPPPVELHSSAMEIRPLLLAFEPKGDTDKWPVVGYYLGGIIQEWRRQNSPSEWKPTHYRPMPNNPNIK